MKENKGFIAMRDAFDLAGNYLTLVRTEETNYSKVDCTMVSRHDETVNVRIQDKLVYQGKGIKQFNLHGK